MANEHVNSGNVFVKSGFGVDLKGAYAFCFTVPYDTIWLNINLSRIKHPPFTFFSGRCNLDIAAGGIGVEVDKVKNQGFSMVNTGELGGWWAETYSVYFKFPSGQRVSIRVSDVETGDFEYRFQLIAFKDNGGGFVP